VIWEKLNTSSKPNLPIKMDGLDSAVREMKMGLLFQLAKAS